MTAYNSIQTEVGGKWKGSPFVNPPIGILIHGMSEYLDSLHAPIWLRDKAGLSAHCFVTPQGGRHIGQAVTHQAWHAGISSYQGASSLNKSFLGLELLLVGHHTFEQFKVAVNKKGAYTEAQHYATALQCSIWMAKIPTINPENIRGHSEVSGAQFRSDYKVDPGQGWNWHLFYKFLHEFGV